MSEREEVMVGVATADAETLKRMRDVLKGKDRTKTGATEHKRLIKIKEAVEILGVARQTVYNLIKQGRLETVNLNGVQRVREQSLIDFADGRREAVAKC
jgi:excisionase family DNA binding protein